MTFENIIYNLVGCKKHFQNQNKTGNFMQKLKCGVLGATGMVGREFLKLLSVHPWIEVTVVAASSKSAGQKLKYLIDIDRQARIDRDILDLTVQDVYEIDDISSKVDFVFCALNMDKAEIIALEEAYAKKEVVVVSNNSAMRFVSDVPMIVPEINGIEHLQILETQKQRLGTQNGCIVVKPNCAAQAYMAILDVVRNFIEVDNITVSLMQAISGSGKYLYEVPEILGNILPLPGEAEKSITEPKKIFGFVIDNEILDDLELELSAISYRVPVQDGHVANIFIKTRKGIKNLAKDLKIRFKNYNPLKELNLPSSPNPVINYLGDDIYPTPIENVNNQGGMEFTCGAMSYNDDTGILQITGLIHNLVRGAAGGAVLTAELMIKLGYINTKEV